MKVLNLNELEKVNGGSFKSFLKGFAIGAALMGCASVPIVRQARATVACAGYVAGVISNW